jgi:transposase
MANDADEWQAFAKTLRRLLHDGIRFRKRDDSAPDTYRIRVDQLNNRLADLAAVEHEDGNTRRLTKRLRKYVEYLFTFLDYDHVPFENNFAERQIRPAVILRKNSQSNRSERGAATQAVLMSVYRTHRLRGLARTKTIAEGLKTYLATGQLTTLPAGTIAGG